MKVIKKGIFTLLMAILLIFPLASTITAPANQVHANIICDVFPFINNVGALGINSVCNGGKTGTVVTRTKDLIIFALNLIFVGLIIIAVFIIIRSAIKYIQSEGNESKIQEAQKAIKAVFVGIAVLIVGIVGIFIILAFFQASGATNVTNTPQEIQEITNQ